MEKNAKFSLNDLKVKSFTTTDGNADANTVKGGTQGSWPNCSYVTYVEVCQSCTTPYQACCF